MDCTCIQCGRNYIYSRNKGHTFKKCNSCLVNYRRFELKKKCIEYLGGKCSKCGYNKSLQSLCFHHLDPQIKKFKISGSHSHSWKTIEEELKKCILLCHNCHHELHEQINLSSGLSH